MTREEALQAIKEKIAYYERDKRLKGAIETLIPELAESEDERIRKFLIDYFGIIKSTLSDDGVWKGFQIKKILAFLEKQKEQTEDLSTRLNGVMQEYVKAGKDEEEQEHRLKCYQLFWDALGDSEFFEQKEQKPAEWSDEDEEMQDNIICILQKDITFTPPTRPNSCTGSGNAFYTHQTEIDWLKSLPLNLKKKNEDVAKLCSNEWSKEDEANLDYLIDYCNSQENGQHPILVTSIARKISLWLYRLKSGEITIKRQANEGWSNDDEERFDSVCSVLRSKLDEGNWKPLIDLLLRLKTAYCYQGAYNEKDEKTIHLACEFIRHHARKNDSIGGINCSELVERLKSLRPQPKQEWSEDVIKKIRSEEYTKGFNDAAFGGKLKEWSEDIIKDKVKVDKK